MTATTPIETSNRTVSAARETDDAPARVLGALADARQLSRWAPGFADEVTRSDDRWEVRKGDDRFELRVVVDQGAGTVDYLRQVAPDVWLGAFLRVTPRPGGGAVITMTLPIVPGTDADTTAKILDGELSALTGLVNGR